MFSAAGSLTSARGRTETEGKRPGRGSRLVKRFANSVLLPVVTKRLDTGRGFGRPTAFCSVWGDPVRDRRSNRSHPPKRVKYRYYIPRRTVGAGAGRPEDKSAARPDVFAMLHGHKKSAGTEKQQNKRGYRFDEFEPKHEPDLSRAVNGIN